MMISKHHYAIELINRGNKVYFINPPQNKVALKVYELEVYKGLYVVDSGILFLRSLRFYSTLLFKYYNRINLKRIVREIGRPIDVVWSFEQFGYNDFSVFKNQLKIAHPVDFTLKSELINANGADILFSVAKEIIEEFAILKIPSFIVNHAISESFQKSVVHEINQNGKLTVTYVGNLLRQDIDYDMITKIVVGNPKCLFTFIGSFKTSNASNVVNNQMEQVEFLINQVNTRFLGVLNQELLAKHMSKTDLFLICYDIEKDVCRGTNYHKVIEYLAIGKCIISHPISAYQDLDLIEMSNKNEGLELIFDNVINNLEYYNSDAKCRKRIEFANSNTYSNNIGIIDDYIFKNLV